MRVAVVMMGMFVMMIVRLVRMVMSRMNVIVVSMVVVMMVFVLVDSRRSQPPEAFIEKRCADHDNRKARERPEYRDDSLGGDILRQK